MKQIEIIYQPGYGGNFLTYLFSLDPSTVPYWVDSDDVAERLKAYDFNNTKKYTNWKIFHEYGRKKFPRDHHDTLISCRHSQKYIRDPRKFVPVPGHSYYLVDLSRQDWPNYWLVSSKKRLGDFPAVYLDMLQEENEIRKNYSFPTISLDCFLDPAQWETPEPKNNFAVQRLGDEQQEPFVHFLSMELVGGSRDRAFVKRYREIKHTHWPDCESEKDFDQLPDAIKKELIEIFNYTPKEEIK